MARAGNGSSLPGGAALACCALLRLVAPAGAQDGGFQNRIGPNLPSPSMPSPAMPSPVMPSSGMSGPGVPPLPNEASAALTLAAVFAGGDKPLRSGLAWASGRLPMRYVDLSLSAGADVAAPARHDPRSTGGGAGDRSPAAGRRS